jgi:TIR domain
MHHVFICHPDKNKEIVENLAGRLRELGVEAWVYSLDKTLAEAVWNEIESKILESQVFMFVASKYSLDANGQHRELQLALERLKDKKVPLRLLPVIIDGIDFGSLPEELRRINGLWLNAHTVKSTAFEIAKTFFSDLVAVEKKQDWRYPRPGQWLEVCHIDQWIEEHFDLGDRVYFRRISPLGLFECYSPRLKGLFWFAPRNLCATDVVDEDGTLERRDVPCSYRYSASYDFEGIGIDEMRKRGKIQ